MGTHTETTNVFTVNIERELKNREIEYCDFNDLNVMLVTWNIGGADVPVSYDFGKTLFNF